MGYEGIRATLVLFAAESFERVREQGTQAWVCFASRTVRYNKPSALRASIYPHTHTYIQLLLIFYIGGRGGRAESDSPCRFILIAAAEIYLFYIRARRFDCPGKWERMETRATWGGRQAGDDAFREIYTEPRVKSKLPFEYIYMYSCRSSAASN